MDKKEEQKIVSDGKGQIVQLWNFQTLVFEQHTDHTCPQKVIVVEIDKDLELG